MCALRVDSLSGQASTPPINFARNSPATCSNIEFASFELQRFWGVSKNDHDKSRAKFGRRWCRCCPWAPPPGPAGQAARLSETPVTFAGAGRALIETAIAFASDERPFLGHFDPAKVLVVSMGRAAWPAKVLLVSKLPRHRVLCAKKFALLGLMVGVSAKKFALHAHNTPQSAFLRLLGEFFRGSAAGGAVLGEFFSRKSRWRGCAGRVFSRTGSRGIPRGELCCAVALVVGPSTGSVNPSIRSYTHLVQAGSGRPTRPSNRPRNAKR